MLNLLHRDVWGNLQSESAEMFKRYKLENKQFSIIWNLPLRLNVMFIQLRKAPLEDYIKLICCLKTIQWLITCTCSLTHQLTSADPPERTFQIPESPELNIWMRLTTIQATKTTAELKPSAVKLWIILSLYLTCVRVLLSFFLFLMWSVCFSKVPYK